MYAAEPNRSPSSMPTRTPSIPDPIQDSIREFTAAIESSLCAYRERYLKTGYLEIFSDELVAAMALEGNVFSPDRAFEKLSQVTTAMQRIEHVSFDLQSMLLDKSEIRGHRQTAQLKLQILNKSTLCLIALVEHDVLPVLHLVAGSRKEMLTALSEIKELVSYFVTFFEIAIIDATGKHEETCLTMIRYLTEFVAKSQLVAVVSVKAIKSRVPLYCLAE